MSESVNHPSHYQKEGHKECISEMIEKYGEVPVYWFCMLNAYKYEYRAGLKSDAETDLRKAEWYRNYACKLMDEAATRCCNTKCVPIEVYKIHIDALMHVMTAEEKAEIDSMPIFNSKCGNCGAMCFDDDTYCSECGAYFGE